MHMIDAIVELLLVSLIVFLWVSMISFLFVWYLRDLAEYRNKNYKFRLWRRK